MRSEAALQLTHPRRLKTIVTMMMPARLSDLSCVLLALLWIRPRSGYDLRKLFRESSMARFSSSPGSIYPALRRLEGLELILSDTSPGDRGRPRTSYSLTVNGERTLMGWLKAPVTEEEVRTAPELACFRLALLPDAASPSEAVLRFEELERAIDGQIRFLMTYLASPPPGMGPRTAAELALDLWAARGNWARRMLSTLRMQSETEPGSHPDPVHFPA
jgi:DNA-binding PadR family transcriptional regulator